MTPAQARSGLIKFLLPASSMTIRMTAISLIEVSAKALLSFELEEILDALSPSVNNGIKINGPKYKQRAP